jgi:HSP20 family molecular chaperone IbpA
MSNAETTATSPADETVRRLRRPRYSVVSGAEGHELRVVMPGVSKEGVSIQLDGRLLRIEGSRSDRPKPEWRPVLRELAWDDYRLVLELNVQIDEGAIVAEVNDGVLTLRLPKAESAKPRRIEVS